GQRADPEPALAARTIPIRPSALRPVGRADRARVHGPETPGPSRRVRFTVPEPPACLPAERLPARPRFRGHRCFPCRTTEGATRQQGQHGASEFTRADHTCRTRRARGRAQFAVVAGELPRAAGWRGNAVRERRASGVAVQEARQGGVDPGAHEGGCTCGDCPHGAREGHRRAVAAVLLRRDEFAAGQGLPAAVAHSASASRQWVSEELTQAAELVAERSRAEGTAWLARLWQRTAVTVWAGVVALLLVQALTAIGAGWTSARSAGLLAAVVAAGAVTAASWFHRARGGPLAPVIGE